MISRRWPSLVLGLLLVLVVSACGGAEPTPSPEAPPSMPSAQPSPVASEPAPELSPLATATPLPQASPGLDASPLPTPGSEAPAPMELVVLHSNDNWGETEPCG